jgi:hypothetical protein
VYDPVKAHQYYIRTRQLKGRRPGAGTASVGRRTRSSTYTVRYGGQKVKLSQRELAEQTAYAARRVNSIKLRLAELTITLRKMRAEAGVKETETKRKAKKAPTAADKSKAARESKQYREKHKQELSTKSKRASKKRSAKSESDTDAVAELEDKIAEVKSRLTAVVARQRALAGATKNS